MLYPLSYRGVVGQSVPYCELFGGRPGCRLAPLRRSRGGGNLDVHTPIHSRPPSHAPLPSFPRRREPRRAYPHPQQAVRRTRPRPSFPRRREPRRTHALIRRGRFMRVLNSPSSPSRRPSACDGGGGCCGWGYARRGSRLRGNDGGEAGTSPHPRPHPQGALHACSEFVFVPLPPPIRVRRGGCCGWGYARRGSRLRGNDGWRVRSRGWGWRSPCRGRRWGRRGRTGAKRASSQYSGAWWRIRDSNPWSSP